MTILALALTVTFGCRNEEAPGRATLLEAERLIDIWQIDSASTLMDNAKSMTFGGKADSALYALNHIRLKKMQGIVLTDDSLATLAADFYSKIGDVHRAMLAWYYLTCQLFDTGHYTEAAVCAEKMKNYAELEQDHLYLARYGDIMGHCAELVGNNLSAARHFTYSYRQFKDNIPDSENYIDFFFCMARNAWLKSGRIDSALILSREIKPIILSMTDTNTVSRWISNHATMLLNNRVRDYEGAKALYREMDSIGAPYWPEASNHRITQALIKALSERDTVAWHQAMELINKYGTRDIAYGYFVNDMTADDFYEANAHFMTNAQFTEETYPTHGVENEDASGEDEGSADWLTWALIAVAAALCGAIWAFRRK